MRNWINLVEAQNAEGIRNPDPRAFDELMAEWNGEGHVSFTPSGDVVCSQHPEVDPRWPTAKCTGFSDGRYLSFYNCERYNWEWFTTEFLPLLHASLNVKKILGRGQIVAEFDDGRIFYVTNASSLKRVLADIKWVNRSLGADHAAVGGAEALFKRYGGKVMPFDQLPGAAQKALTHYMTVDGDNPGFADELMFGFVMLPAAALKKLCWNAPMNDMRDDYADWDAYHESYWSIEDDTEYQSHLDDKWPVILSDEEGIMDGWHRFHWYLRNGIKKIPAVLLVDPDDA